MDYARHHDTARNVQSHPHDPACRSRMPHPEQKYCSYRRARNTPESDLYSQEPILRIRSSAQHLRVAEHPQYFRVRESPGFARLEWSELPDRKVHSCVPAGADAFPECVPDGAGSAPEQMKTRQNGSRAAAPRAGVRARGAGSSAAQKHPVREPPLPMLKTHARKELARMKLRGLHPGHRRTGRVRGPAAEGT